jgi:UDP-3-O-[3-hydroxymyristoyl] N-acetylglucosamine deacetylase
VIFQRKTIASSVKFIGKGLHSGVPVTMIVHPGDMKSHAPKIEFRNKSTRTLAIPSNVSDTTRSTRLGEFGTVEHIMSAFAGCEITDAVVEMDALEAPGMDGSATQYVQEFERVGYVNGKEYELPLLYTRLFLQAESIKIAVGKGEGHWRYEYETGERWPHSMAYESFDVIKNYSDEIAPARTFALHEEIPQIMKMGLGLGLDADSALVLGDDGYKNVARFTDEPARHKLLDLIGDLYLSGVPVKCLNVVGTKSGHRAHIEMSNMLAKSMEKK